jgi:dTDP-4-amino-4,6-dideoxygalactose transaminase
VVVIPRRHQLAAHSPLTAKAVLNAAYAAACLDDPFSHLSRILQNHFSADSVELTDSGTSALQLAIRLALRCAPTLGSTPDDVVALPAFTCYEVGAAAVGANVRIALYDVDPDTLAPDTASLERALIAGARVVVATSLFGLPLDWSRILKQVQRHGAVLIEDAAQGHGASWQGQPLGSFGGISVLSFGRGKGWTGGGGGALLLRGDAVHEWREQRSVLSPARSFGTIGPAVAQFALGRPALYGIPARLPGLKLGRAVYHSPKTPRGMSPAAAALIARTCKDAAREAGTRRDTAAVWRACLTGEGHLRPFDAPAGGIAGFLRFPVRVTGGGQRSRELLDRGHHLGIAQTYPTTLALVPALRARMLEPRVPTPGADSLVRELVTLPTHSLLSADDRRAIQSLCASADLAPQGPRVSTSSCSAIAEVVSASRSGT